jgi:hypothetical protein
MTTKHEIVFEDLHAAPDDEEVHVDLDADTNDDGITRVPAKKAGADDTGDDDDVIIDPDDDDELSLSGDDDDDDETGGGDGGDDYSIKVKKRIDRATRATKKAKDEASHWKQQAVDANSRLTQLRADSAKSVISKVDDQIESTQASLEQAIEDGKTKEQVRLTSQLTDLKAEKITAQMTIDAEPPAGVDQPDGGKVSRTSTNPRADSWREDNSDWYGQSGFERQTRLANRIDKDVYNDGYEANTEEYFQELTKRLKEKEPDLFSDGKKPARSKTRSKRSPVAGADDVSAQQKKASSGSNKVVLTERDFAVMREFNLDPSDPEVLKEFARNKQEAERTET